MLTLKSECSKTLTYYSIQFYKALIISFTRFIYFFAFLAIATSETAVGVSLVLLQSSNNYSNLFRAIIFRFFFSLPKSACAKNDAKHIGLIWYPIT